jgi:hypothetical protein
MMLLVARKEEKVLRYNINDGVVRDSVVKSRIVEYELLEEAER